MVVFLVIFVFIGIYFVYNKPQNNPDPNNFFSRYASPDTWGNNRQGPDTSRNICRLYTFPGTMSGTTAFPGEPNLNPSVIETLTPENLGGCIDIDQLAAQQLVHTCLDVINPSDGGGVSFCYKYDGTLASPGDDETYYSSQNCGIPSCTGALSLVAVNFNPPGVYQCLIKVGNNLDVGECDIGDENQLFRVTRVNQGATIPPAPGQNSGPIAQIFDRDTNQCMGLSGPTPILGPCNVNQGYSWGLFPPYVDPNTMKTVPQQIGYIGDLVLPNFSDAQDIINFVTANNIQVISPSGNDLITVNYSFDNSTVQGKLNTGQYIDYNLYNIIINSNTPFLDDP